MRILILRAKKLWTATVMTSIPTKHQIEDP